MNREELILSLTAQVRGLAASRHCRVPDFVPAVDLIGEAWIGAIHAVDRWDPARNMLSTCAKTPIKGAMLDYLRRVDPLTRDHRREFKAAEEAALRADRPPPEPLTVQLEPEMELLGGEDPRLSQIEKRADIVSILDHAKLDRRERLITLRHYMGDEQLRALARELGIDESRVSQIRKRALGKLRAINDKLSGYVYHPNYCPDGRRKRQAQPGARSFRRGYSAQANRTASEGCEGSGDSNGRGHGERSDSPERSGGLEREAAQSSFPPHEKDVGHAQGGSSPY
jgi:RNA polymerase sigma factor (sigma-70 family)